MLISAAFRHVAKLTEPEVWSSRRRSDGVDECTLRPALLTAPLTIEHARSQIEAALTNGHRCDLTIEVRKNPKHPEEPLTADLMLLRHVFPVDDVATRAVRSLLERQGRAIVTAFDAAIRATTEALADARPHVLLAEAAGGHELLCIDVELVTPYVDEMLHMLDGNETLRHHGPFVALVRFGTVRDRSKRPGECDIILLGRDGQLVPEPVQTHVLTWTAGWSQGWLQARAARGE